MKKTENGKIFAFIAASLLMGCWLHQVSRPIIHFLDYMEYGWDNLSLIIDLTALLGIAVTLFTRSKKAVLAACGLEVLIDAYQLIRYFSVGNLVACLLFAGMVTLLVLSLKKSALLTKIWFVPAAIYALYSVINRIQGIYVSICIYLAWVAGDINIYLKNQLRTALMYLLLSIIYSVAWFLVCLWIKKSTEPVKIVFENENTTLNTQAIETVPTSLDTIGGADQLKTYKELLDLGVITQEEFDAKKNEILNL